MIEWGLQATERTGMWGAVAMDEDAVLALAILASALGAILLMFVFADIGTAPEGRSALGLIDGLRTR